MNEQVTHETTPGLSSIGTPARHLMIIGAMKSGTTTLFDLLATNDTIIPAIVKEPEFFSENQAHRVNEITDYYDLWPVQDSPQGAFLMEASTGYTKYPREPGVPERIKQAGLEPFFIYIVRDPIKRIESQMNWAVHFPWFYPEKTSDDDVYITPSMYNMQLFRYMRHFDLSKFLILDFDDMITNPALTCQSVSTFLGIENRFDLTVLEKIRNVTRTETWGERIVLRTPRLKQAYWNLPERVRHSLRRHILSRTPCAGKLRLPEAERQSVRNRLADDVQRFGQNFNFPIDKWGF